MTISRISHNFLIITALALFFSCAEAPQKEAELSSEPLKVTFIENEGDAPTAKLFIEGMTCERMCVNTIKKSVAQLPSVTIEEMIFDADVAVDTLIVHFDPKTIGEKELVKAVEELAGGNTYHVKEIQLTKDSRASSCTRNSVKKEENSNAERRLRLPNLFDMLKKVSI